MLSQWLLPLVCARLVTAQNASSEKESCMHGLDCSEHKGVEAVKWQEQQRRSTGAVGGVALLKYWA